MLRQDLSRQYAVRSIPTVKIFRHGDVVAEFTGVQNEEYIKRLLEPFIPNESDDIRKQAIALIGQGDLQAGRELLIQALEKDPNNLTIHIDLAQMDAEQGDFQAAQARLSTLGREAKEKPEVASLLAKIEFAGAAETNDDIDTLLQHIADDPKNSRARYELAAKYVLQENYPAALDQLFAIAYAR